MGCTNIVHITSATMVQQVGSNGYRASAFAIALHQPSHNMRAREATMSEPEVNLVVLGLLILAGLVGVALVLVILLLIA